MADFLSKAISAHASEEIELLGTKIEVRGLSIGELVALTKSKKGEEKDNVSLTSALIAACCFTKDGSPLVPADKVEMIKLFPPTVFGALNDAVTRVNGVLPGNLRATAKGA